MPPFRAAGAIVVALAAPWLWVPTAHAEGFAQLGQVPVVASPTCAGSVSAEAQVTPVQVDDRVEDGVRVAIRYDAGIYDGSCALTVTAAWANLDSGASGSSDITAVSTIDGHYGLIGYANTTFETGSGTWSSRSVRTRVPNCGSRREPPDTPLRVCGIWWIWWRPVSRDLTPAHAPRRLHPRHAPFKTRTIQGVDTKVRISGVD